ncbi:hypothetical protein M5689_019161 [Euphorbia peplus]|nr:hypothetical protein M5689_019161 [Euphorbia peplus]
MATVAAEDGVLKLVHPGRNVEIIRKPVTAAEVMRRYPRHSVTRPDVFEYPWVVVRPESMLNIGKVFFVVPNRTIYKLMKEHKEKNREILSPKNKNIPYLKDQCQADSPVKINAGSTPKHLNRLRSLNQSPPSPITTCMCTSSLDPNRDSRTRKQNKVGSWPDVNIMSKNENMNIYLKHGAKEKQKRVTGSRILLRSFDDDDFESMDSKKAADLHGKLLEYQQNKEVSNTMLKSCLRKRESSRRLLPLRVSFFLPVEHKE